MDKFEQTALHLGLCCPRLAVEECALPRGMTLRQVKAHVMAPLILKGNAGPDPTTPIKWFAMGGGNEYEISAEICIPVDAAVSFQRRAQLARMAIFLIRIWVDPSVTAPAFSVTSFERPYDIQSGEIAIYPLEMMPRYFQLAPSLPVDVADGLSWVAKHFDCAYRLYHDNAQFQLAADALDMGQFIQNDALALISLWGGLEALFSPSTSELRFRVSALVASYMHPPGSERRAAQQDIARLYDKRSAAAHGRPNHNGEDLLKTFELVRHVLIRMITKGSVPTREDLEELLFGAGQT